MDKKKSNIYNMTAILSMIAMVMSLSLLFVATTEFSDKYIFTEISLGLLAAFLGAVTSLILLKILMQKKVGDIFISYSHKDRKFVEKLIRDMRAKHFNVIYDEDVVKIGDNIKETILANIKKADLVIVVISNNALASDFSKQEMRDAIENKKKILPIVIDDNVEIPTELLKIRYADFSKEYEENLKQLIKSLISSLKERHQDVNLIK